MKEVVIWFDKDLNLHTESCHFDNSFALSKFQSYNSNIVFKANAIIEGNTILFNFSQVTINARTMIGRYFTSSSAVRKNFFNRHLKTIESKIKSYVNTKGYKKPVVIRFRIGRTTVKTFSDLGYTRLNSTCESQKMYDGFTWAEFVIVTKTV